MVAMCKCSFHSIFIHNIELETVFYSMYFFCNASANIVGSVAQEEKISMYNMHHHSVNTSSTSNP